MSTAGDSADELVKIMLEGIEVAFRIAGDGAKNIGAILLAIMKDVEQTRGKTRLTSLLKSGKELKIYSFQAEDLKKFSQEAKRYGVRYCVLANRKDKKIDGIVDVMIREEDAVKVNRIADRFNFANVDKALMSRELGLEIENGQSPQDIGVQEKTPEEKLIDELLSKPIQKEEQQQEKNPEEEKLPSKDNTEEKNQSETSLDTNQSKKKTNKNKSENKKSVREELKQITEEVRKREAQKSNENEQVQTSKKQQSKHFKEKEEKKKAKHYKQPKHLNNKSNKSKRRER